jgi:hypothetical protein
MYDTIAEVKNNVGFISCILYSYFLFPNATKVNRVWYLTVDINIVDIHVPSGIF